MYYGSKKTTTRRKTNRSRSTKRTRTTGRLSLYRRPSTISKVGTVWKNPLPNQGIFKFKYRDTSFTLNPAVGNGYQATYSYRGNGMYDPDASGIGVQPYGYDQMLGALAPFQRYRVFASKITIYPSITAGNASALKIAVMPTPDVSPPYIGIDDLAQFKGFRMLKMASVQTSQNAPNKLTTYAKTSWFYNVKDNDNEADYGSNPAKQWYYFIIADNLAQSTDVTAKIDIQITYYAVLHKTLDVNES